MSIPLSGTTLPNQAEAFRRDRRQFDRLFANMGEGFAYYQTVEEDGEVVDYVFVDVNDAFGKITGLGREVVGRRGSEVYGVSSEDFRKRMDVYRKAVSGEPAKLEFYSPQARKWLAISSYSVEKGYFAAILQDMTERKKLEEKNREYAEHLEELVAEQVLDERQRIYNVLESLPAYIVLLDKDHRMPFANKFFRERFGDSRGRPCFEYLFNRNEACENCETYKVMKTNAPHRWEWLGPDGRLYDVYDFPFVGTNGSNMILEMGIDITEQKRAQESLRSAAQYARSLIEASPDPLVTISADGKITDANEATVGVTGVSREEIIGTDFSNYFTEPEKARQGYQEVFTKGFVKDYPLAILHRSGRITEVLYNATVYRNEAGRIQGVFAAARDVTEHYAMERKLKDSERLATIGATASMVGHDIRNPLQAITGALWLIRDDLESLPDSAEKKDMRDLLGSVDDSIRYIDKIVADLQDYVRPIQPALKIVDLKNLLEETLSGISIPDNVETAVKVESGFDVRVDPDLMRRVFTNLAGNAIQAMPNGGSLTVEAHNYENGFLASLRDTGVGMPEDVKSKLFTPLFTTKSRGQGFGLVVCKRIVEAHNGEITFESEVGKGTIFRVKIPHLIM